jgi:rieske iron-sulfur protein
MASARHFKNEETVVNTMNEQNVSNEKTGISRRKLLKCGCGLVGAAALVTMGGSLKAAAMMGPGAMPRPKETGLPHEGDLLTFGDGARKGTPISLQDIPVGGPPVLAQATDGPTGAARDDEHSSVLLVRVAPEAVPADLQDGAAQGVLAYSALCTHLGCVLNEWDAEKKLFQCPCHEALFDPMQAGKVIGGPGPRPLPVLPVKISENRLVVAGDFSGWVGAKRG